ncbi:galactose mutarotase [Cognatishimia sp. WU-CL00825]|uniref:aldose epimerase family protein n=1 Tax=Cognatishimia sp. WU-CL00825 TaxID=3127658 RepID=UPI003101ED0A
MAITQTAMTLRGQEIQQVTLTGGGLTAKIVTAGAAVQDLRLKGVSHPLVLGFENILDYQDNKACMGAIAGRFANRIGGAAFQIDGKTYQLDRNWLGRHTLHGGTDGLQYQNWHIAEMSENSVTLSIVSPDGHMGFPGNLSIDCTYTLLDNATLDISLIATTDQATICGLALHCYFNLDGRPKVDAHKVQILTQHALEYDEEHIATGAVVDITGTERDLQSPRALVGALLDTNYCVSDKQTLLRDVAHVTTADESPNLTIATDQPGLQIFNAPEFSLVDAGLDGRSYGGYAGLAIEPQNWPDAPNKAEFPNAILRPGDTYTNHSQFKFT